MSATLSAAGAVLERNYRSYRKVWWVFLTGFFEPVFYLFSIGVGVGALVSGFTFHGVHIGYAAFVAPAMLATSAFNGALLDSTFNFFFKLKFEKVFDQMLATPMTTRQVALGELVWMLIRGSIYSTAFLLIMVVMGYVDSWWALLALPGAALISLTVAGVGMALTTFMRTFQDFELVTLVQLPMFLFSATFYPISAYPTAVQWLVEVTPLYRGVVLMRELTTGLVTWESAFSVVYLIALGLAGLWLADRRMGKLLLT